jgi:hypothetical protein
LPAPATTEVSDDKIEDAREVAAASASPAHVEAGPSGAMPVELVKESILEKPMSPAPEAPSQGYLNYLFDMLQKSSYQQSNLPKRNIMLRR